MTAQISELLASVLDDPREEQTLHDILDHFGDRALGAMMVVFAAPLVLPMPPGLSAVLGLPLLIFTAQLAIGSRRAWVPGFLAKRPIRRQDLANVITRILPLVMKMETLLRPRMSWLLAPLTARLVGIVAFILAVIVFLPIPFGNMFPSLAIAFLGLGLVERDGLAVVLGWLVAVISLAILAFISKALVAATLVFFRVIAGSLGF